MHIGASFRGKLRFCYSHEISAHTQTHTQKLLILLANISSPLSPQCVWCWRAWGNYQISATSCTLSHKSPSPALQMHNTERGFGKSRTLENRSLLSQSFPVENHQIFQLLSCRNMNWWTAKRESLFYFVTFEKQYNNQDCAIQVSCIGINLKIEVSQLFSV